MMAWLEGFFKELEKYREAKQEARKAKQKLKEFLMLYEWISNPVDTYKLGKVLENMKKKDIEACKNELECVLKKDVVSLVFWDNIEKLKWQDFWGWEIRNYRHTYLSTWVTDFWNDLANKNISFQGIGEDYDKKIELSFQYWIQRGIQEVYVNIPFRQQYNNGSNFYKVNLEDMGIKYIWLTPIECIVNLINFCKETHAQLEKVLLNNRKLWIFGD